MKITREGTYCYTSHSFREQYRIHLGGEYIKNIDKFVTYLSAEMVRPQMFMHQVPYSSAINFELGETVFTLSVEAAENVVYFILDKEHYPELTEEEVVEALRKIISKLTKALSYASEYSRLQTAFTPKQQEVGNNGN